MIKIKLPILVLSMGLMACGGSEELEQLTAELDALNEELTEEVIPETVEESDLFSSEDGKFKINFLGEPTVTSDIIPTDVGDIEMMSFMYEKSVTEAYMVAYSDYPTEMVEASSTQDMLKGAKDGASGNLGITSFDLEENIELNGNEGMYFKGAAGSIFVEYKIFLVGNRLYQVAILRDGSYATEERSGEFFNSFELVSE